MTLPLAGIRILTVEHYGAGPFGTVHLADLGADVIKIEARDSGGDMSRGVGPHHLGAHDSTFFQPYNRNKRSLCLDLKAARGRAVFHRLVAGADAVFNNLRGSQPGRLGLAYADLAAHNPRIVCGHLSAYGRGGSRADRPGYDYLLQAECGYVAVTGEPDAAPARMGLSVVDHLTGLTAALGLLAAIVGARRDGKGRDVDVSLYDTAIHQTTYPAAWYLNHGAETTRLPRSAHPSIAPSQLFPTADGWLFVMCQTQRFWEKLCAGIGAPALATDPRFATPADRRANRAALSDVLDGHFTQRTTAQWMAGLAGSVPLAPVLTLAQALDNGFLHERRGVQSMPHAELGTLHLLADPIRLDGEPLPARAAPALGADGADVLAESGFTAAEIEALQRDGVI
ncbi:CoA transferase [Vineibacter terrae]|uniref:CoA transferase n=1 Tax=Vineibacter terrae TaxID=2586908 RepID=A0A5C8PEC3_9HYPH|nr:CoA transferase [Vineibacter terrae]TXL71689.1 CoA transferase [Vineibacter terrae]